MDDKEVERVLVVFESLGTKVAISQSDGLLQSELLSAAALIRRLVQERDNAYQEGQRDMQLRALEKARRADIFADIQDIDIRR